MQFLQPLSHLHPRPLSYLSERLSHLVSGKLWLKVLIGMGLGIVVGLLLGPSAQLVSPQMSATIGSWLALPGQLFLVLVQMIVIPLVFASIIRGLASGESIDQLKKVGIWAVVFFLLTTTVAIILGIALGTLLEPGSFVSAEAVKGIATASAGGATDSALTAPSLQEIPSVLIGLLPRNPLGAMVSNEMLQIVLFAIVFGISLVSIPPQTSKPLLEVLGALLEVCMNIVKAAMRLAPFAVFGLIAQLTSQLGMDVLIGVGAYVGTVLLGLLIILIGYTVVIGVFTKIGWLLFLKNAKEVQLLAFSTSSSAAVMPLSIKTLEEKFSVRPSIAQFIIPLGATINMNGTALYQGVAAIFIAQVFGIDLSIGALTALIVTAVGASIGSPATPGVGIVILGSVLESIGVPIAGIALILGVDRILDMSRTAVNVTGDFVVAILLDRYIGGEKTAEHELASREKREKQREKTGEDVLISKPAST